MSKIAKYGLKEIRLVNSGSFMHEKINVEESALLLGSSGTGKTSILSIATFFYTLDKDKVRPDTQPKSFFDWHLETPYSHIMYRYTNSIGDILFIVSKDENKTVFLFVNISGLKQDLETLYLDEEGNALTHKEIKSNLLTHSIMHYSALNLNTARKVLHRNEYGNFAKGQKPMVDFSLFKDIKSSAAFGTHLYKIYKNSTIKDSSLKQVFISLVSEEERALSLIDLKRELSGSLSSIEEIESINNKKEKILELDKKILEFSLLKEKKYAYEFKIFSIKNNKRTFNEVIENKDSHFLTEKKSLEESLVKKRAKKEDMLNTLNTKISQLNQQRLDTLEQEKEYVNQKNIKSLIEEFSKEEFYKDQVKILSTKIQAMGADIQRIDEAENQAKESEKISVARDEKIVTQTLSNELDTIKDKKIGLLQDKLVKPTEVTNHLKEELKNMQDEIASIEISIIKKEVWIAEVPNREVKNAKTISLKENIGNLFQRKETYGSQKIEYEGQIDATTAKRDNENEESLLKREKEVATYYEKKEAIDTEIGHLKARLNVGKKNLFGYINEISHPHTKTILAITSEEVLFSEKYTFSEVDKSQTFFGLEVEGNLEAEYKKYDVDLINTSLGNYSINRDTLVAKHNITMRNIDEDVRKRDKLHKTDMLILRRKLNEADSLFKTMEMKISDEEQTLSLEIQKIKEKNEQDILEQKNLKLDEERKLKQLKEVLASNTQQLNDIQDTLKKEIDDEILGIDIRLAGIATELKDIISKYQTILKDGLALITLEYNKIRMQENIDTTQHQQLSGEFSKVQSKLNAINENRAFVSYFINTLEPKINNIPSLEKELVSMENTKYTEIKLFNGMISSLSSELKKLEVKIGEWKTHKANYAKFSSNVDNLIIEVNTTGEVYTIEEAQGILLSDELIQTYENYQNVDSDLEKISNAIKTEVNIITRGVRQDNILNLQTQMDIDIASIDSTQAYISVGMGYIKYIKEQLDIEGISLQLKSLSETISRSAGQLQHIKSDIDLISNEVNKVNKTIRDGISNIRVIDYIQLNFYSYNSDETALKLEFINDMLNENYSALFNNDATATKAKNDIVNEAKELLTILEGTNKKQISISDISRLTFDVGENSNRHNGLITLDTIGSNGTSIMIRTITYLTLLKSVSRKISHLGDVSYHCVLDEIGQISADYFNELLQYTKNLGFSFLNGSAANDEDIISCYKNFYSGIKVGNKTQMIEYINTEIA